MRLTRVLFIYFLEWFDKAGFIADVRKGEKLGGQRKKLSDISNLQERPKLANVDLKKSSTLGTKEYVEKLQKVYFV